MAQELELHAASVPSTAQLSAQLSAQLASREEELRQGMEAEVKARCTALVGLHAAGGWP